MKLNARSLTRIGISAAVYIVATIVLGSISYGPIQFRASEVLNFLAFLDPIYIIGLTIGCAISNFYSFGIIDVFVGSAATLISTYLMWKSRNMLVASFYPTIFCIAVSAELYFLFNMPFIATTISVMFGEFVSMTVIGYPLAKKIFKNKKLISLLCVSNEDITQKLKFLNKK